MLLDRFFALVASLAMGLGAVAVSGCAAEAPPADDGDRDRLALADGVGGVWGGALLRRADGAWLGVALHAEDELGVWRIDPSRRAEAAGTYPTGFHPDGVAVWDEDTFAVVVEGDHRVQFWRIAADGQIGQAADLPSPFGARNLAIADLDGDGRRDLVLGPYDGAELALLWGQGEAADLVFSEPQLLPAGRSPWHPVLVDWDGDGRLDILWAELDTQIVRLAHNEGGRQFAVRELHRVAGVTPRHLAARDLDGDGRPDLAVAVEIGAAEILYQRPDGGLRVATIPPLALGYVSAAIAADGTVLLGEEGRILLARPSPSGWERRTLPARSLPSPMTLADVDADGQEDLVVFHSAGGGVIIHYGPLWDRAEPIEGAAQP